MKKVYLQSSWLLGNIHSITAWVDELNVLHESVIDMLVSEHNG